uniref:RIIa domain-containing protein n=1 Tax=Octopus bimaculoides TaxID=37653 RepID=A0A0L8FVD3_OCTBM
MSFEIPPGLTELLQGFTVSVLRERPANLIQYAADYFTKLNKTSQSSLFSSPGRRKDEWQTGLSKQSSATTEDSGEDDFPPEGKQKKYISLIIQVCINL